MISIFANLKQKACIAFMTAVTFGAPAIALFYPEQAQAISDTSFLKLPAEKASYVVGYINKKIVQDVAAPNSKLETTLNDYFFHSTSGDEIQFVVDFKKMEEDIINAHKEDDQTVEEIIMSCVNNYLKTTKDFANDSVVLNNGNFKLIDSTVAAVPTTQPTGPVASAAPNP